MQNHQSLFRKHGVTAILSGAILITSMALLWISEAGGGGTSGGYEAGFLRKLEVAEQQQRFLSESLTNTTKEVSNLLKVLKAIESDEANGKDTTDDGAEEGLPALPEAQQEQLTEYEEGLALEVKTKAKKRLAAVRTFVEENKKTVLKLIKKKKDE